MSEIAFCGYGVEKLSGQKRNSMALSCAQPRNGYKNHNWSSQRKASGVRGNRKEMKRAQAKRRTGHARQWWWQRVTGAGQMR